MKDKEADQKRDRELRKAERKMMKLGRPEPSLPEKPTILIVCEGENTEPSYFKQYKLSSATIEPIGEGYNTISLVNRAIQLANEKPYEKVWCVFDKDDFKTNDFNNAITLAEANDYHVAYSNQAFEYWIILHFDDHQGGGMHRDSYRDKINTLLRPFGLKYNGDRKIITSEIFELLEGNRTELAIKRAKRNYNRLNHENCASEESSTTVFKLVEELLKYV